MDENKEAEIRYFDEMSDEGLRHAAKKPFSDVLRGHYLADMGQILTLIPPPPARLLDLGCGSGWTTGMFALSGYDALGIDLASAAVKLARETFGQSDAKFEVIDFENLPFEGEFDIAVSYDSLHHSNDIRAVLEGVHRALKSGGELILVEPGKGHSKGESSEVMIEEHGLTENDLPPWVTVPILRKVGFGSIRVLPRVKFHLTERSQRSGIEKFLRRLFGNFVTSITLAARRAAKVHNHGIVLARK